MNVTDDVDPGLRFRLQLLGDALKRANTPKKRRRIERQMMAIEREIERIKSLENEVDLAYERWAQHMETLMMDVPKYGDGSD